MAFCGFRETQKSNIASSRAPSEQYKFKIGLFINNNNNNHHHHHHHNNNINVKKVFIIFIRVLRGLVFRNQS